MHFDKRENRFGERRAGELFVPLVERLRSQDVVWTLIKDGDHRLSRPEDIKRTVDVVSKLAEQTVE